jgi:hypothetical protein
MVKVSHDDDRKFCFILSRDLRVPPGIITSARELEKPGWTTSRDIAVRAVRLSRAEQCSFIQRSGSSWRGRAELRGPFTHSDLAVTKSLTAFSRSLKKDIDFLYMRHILQQSQLSYHRDSLYPGQIRNRVSLQRWIGLPRLAFFFP